MIRFGLYTSFYKCERYVDRIFTNIESLNYENFEWHIVDDFSSDNTKQKVLDRLSISPLKNKIIFYEQSIKKQMYWAPNEFFDGSFEWIVLVDSDDIVDPDFLNVYNRILSKHSDISLVSSDFHKIYEENNSLHSISYILNDEKISDKIQKYHPSCDYLNNISYSCFGHLRAFKHSSIDKFEINNRDAGAEDSYHVFWSNSYGKYLNIPRGLYKWYLRNDSESHGNVPPHFNDNFDISLNKLKSSDFGVETYYNDVYLETSTLLSYPWGQMNGENISLWSRILSEDQKEKITDIYYGVNISFNNPESDTHLVCLNFFSENDLSEVLKKITGKKMLFYYQNQNLHTDNNNKELELQTKLDYYSKTIQNFTGFSWWTYIRHFIIWNQK
jgi:glycosyltransferase involved in cell wall biosynthesis